MPPSRSTILRCILFATLFTSRAAAQPATPPAAANADEAMSILESRAASEHKNILLNFAASWCVNCRRFDGFLADREIHPILDKVFVFADMAAGERPDDQRHPNFPGAENLCQSLGGKDAGFPFIVMLDQSGSTIVNSLRPVGKGSGENIGYPDASYEIDWFMEMLKSAAPSLSARERETIHSWLTAHSSAR